MDWYTTNHLGYEKISVTSIDGFTTPRHFHNHESLEVCSRPGALCGSSLLPTLSTVGVNLDLQELGNRARETTDDPLFDEEALDEATITDSEDLLYL